MRAATSDVDRLGELLVERTSRAAGQKGGDGQSPDLGGLQQRFQRAIHGVHGRLHRTQRWVRESLVEVEALKRTLRDRGLVDDEALEEHRRRFVTALVGDEYAGDGLGITLDRRAGDKYGVEEVEGDCADRWRVCRAICCYILKFSIAKQDVEEGIVQWDQVWPFSIARERDGRCVHLDRETCRCTLREHRPVICRTYSCRNDKRIWRDYDAMVLSDWASREIAKRDLCAGAS